MIRLTIITIIYLIMTQLARVTGRRIALWKK